jgi:hypothetical protein
MSLNEQTDRVENIVGIYPGRFQPMGRHHAEVFRKIQDERGYDHAFIATSDKVSPPRSPFDFSDKQVIASQHDIASSRVVNTKNPYRAQEILEDFNPKTTAVIYYVGAKDMVEDPRFAALGGVKKDGSPRYFREYHNGEDLKGWGEHGYIAIAPHVSIDIPEVGEMSGTNLRNALENADEETFEKIMGFYDAQIYDIIKGKLGQTSLEEARYHLGIFRGLMEEVLEEGFGLPSIGIVGRGEHRVSGHTDDDDDETEEEDLEEISANAAGAAHYPSQSRRRPRRKKLEEDEIVNEFCNYLLNNLEG